MPYQKATVPEPGGPKRERERGSCARRLVAGRPCPGADRPSNRIRLVQLRQAPVNAKAAGPSAVEPLDSVTTGVIHLDRRGGIVAANDPAHARLRKGDGLSDEDGLLRASLFETRSELVRLVAVAETGRFGAAAERLAIAQPALSRAIARLEARLGGRLFERIPTGVRPTPLGTAAVERARCLLREFRAAEEETGAAVSGRAGTFRVTATPVWMRAAIAPTAAAFRELAPGVGLILRTAPFRHGGRPLARPAAAGTARLVARTRTPAPRYRVRAPPLPGGHRGPPRRRGTWRRSACSCARSAARRSTGPDRRRCAAGAGRRPSPHPG